MTETAPNIQDASEQDQSQLTEVGEFDLQTEGYFVIAPLPDDAKEAIYEIQLQLTTQIDAQSLWLPTGDQLHMTFAHIVSPNATYSRAPAEEFAHIQIEATAAVARAAETVAGDVVQFNHLKIFPAAIILEGYDDGTIAQARKQFSEDVRVPEGTRTPPAIIHTTIARFREALPLESIHAALADVTPDISVTVDHLQLVNEHAMYTQSHTVLQEF